MRILRAMVDSFGIFRDKKAEFSPGLNAVYGLNEAGKSTLRAFITNTLFRDDPVKYPASRGTDTGTVDVVLENGDSHQFVKNGKRTGGTAETICNINPKDYISIYSMSPKDLRDTDAIEKGEIRNRFLTIPGGNDLPRAYKELDEERKKFLPDSRRNDSCIIAKRMKEKQDADTEVEKLRNAGDDHYSDLVAKKGLLGQQLSQANLEVSAASAARDDYLRRKSYSNALQRIGELEKRAEKLKYAEKTDEKVRDTYTGLKIRLKNADEEFKKAKQLFEDKKLSIGQIDPARILSAEQQILDLSHQIVRYDCLNEKKARGTEHLDDRIDHRIRTGPLSFLGMAIMLAGVAVAVSGVSLYGGAVAIVAGALLFATAYGIGVKARENVPAPRPDPDVEKEFRELEDLWLSVCERIGMPHRTFSSDVHRMTDMLSRSKEYTSAEKGYRDASDSAEGAHRDVELFLSGYGGEEKFRQALADCKAYNDTVKSLCELKDSLPQEAFSQPEGKPEEEPKIKEVSDNRDRILREISSTEQEIKDIMNSTSVEDAITVASDAENTVYQAVLDWARLALETKILDDACDNAYSTHRPTVLRDSDRFLSDMTGGRYRMNLDPKATDIAVIDSDTGNTKESKEWSSGLEDQIKLSIKMAVALSLSEEKPPVILDDVLLTSDSIRKRGAVKALKELSKEIQVIYFTCDRESRDLLETEGATVTEL